MLGWPNMRNRLTKHQWKSLSNPIIWVSIHQSRAIVITTRELLRGERNPFPTVYKKLLNFSSDWVSARGQEESFWLRDKKTRNYQWPAAVDHENTSEQPKFRSTGTTNVSTNLYQSFYVSSATVTSGECTTCYCSYWLIFSSNNGRKKTKEAAATTTTKKRQHGRNWKTAWIKRHW